MICITGIPATGKTTICGMLNEHGIKCVSLNDVARDLNIIENEYIDIDELKKHKIDADVIESHYSHLLNCDLVIILYNDIDEIKKE
ncbi:AAA family ATPase [Picrophilus oshimae]|uniref:Kinase n=1 Tax=Picrophilus torridus (strain ATCC 700027 / DSM 9790 / JCM 10055 / NBRC 100828 / KAW 2/3) TaxID=1122961 RepID=Q6KZ91_PICTO|nr:AAA family ATPase [Picrophilus oshimae]AAT43961.1 kinase [Picrophilus oshimae DSM 9789]